MTYTAHQTKTIVDTNNTLWNMEYDGMDNSVTIVSDRATNGGYAVLSQYSLDNALGHGIPQAVLSSAEAMLDDDYATNGNEFDVDAFNSMFESLQNPF